MTEARKIVITFPNGEHEPIENGFYSGSIYLTELLSDSNELDFMGCNANMFEATISGISDLSNLTIQVDAIINNSRVHLFRGRVDSCKLQTDRTFRKLTAYDELYYNADTNIAEWYKKFFQEHKEATIKELRDSLFKYIGIKQNVCLLINDSLIITKTIDTDSLAFIDIIKMLCGLNACFGNIGRTGKFEYVYLNQDSEYDISANYRSNSSTAEDYIVQKIDKVQIKTDDEDLGAIAGIGTNAFVIQGNYLTFGLNSNVLSEVAENIYNVVKNIEYTPCDIDSIVSDLNVKLGQKLMIVTHSGRTIKTYCMKNELKGVQLFNQTISAAGDEYRSEVVNDTNSEILQLKGKTFKLEKTVDNFGIALTENLTVNNLLTGTSGTLKDLAVGLYNTLPYGLMIENTELQTGDTVIFRIYIRNPPEGVVGLAARVSHYNSSGKAVENAISDLYIEPGDEGYTQVSTRIRADTTRLQCGITRKASGSAFTVQVKNAKLEKNTIATEWCMSPAEIDSRVTENETSINGAIGELVLKVDKGGRIVQVQLGADAEKGSIFEVNADNINLTATDVLDLLSGGTLNLTGKNISIQSNNFVVDKDGNVTCNSIVMERGQGEDYLKIVVDNDEGFIAYGGFINGKSTKIVDFSTNKSMGGIPAPWYHSLMVENTISSSASGADSTCIDFANSIIRADTLEGYLEGTAKEAKNAPVTERVSVSKFANSTGYADITLGNAYKANSVQVTPRKNAESSAHVTDIAVYELSPGEGKIRIYGTSTVSGNAAAFNVSYIKA